MARPLVSHIIRDIAKIKSRKEKIEALQSQRTNTAVMKMLEYAFSDKVKFELPEGAPPYKKSEVLDNESGLYQELRRMYLFVEGGNPNLKPLRRETLFIQLLEGIHPDEAELVVAVKDKTLPFKGITRKLIEEALPELL